MNALLMSCLFYHSEKLQSTKTFSINGWRDWVFYHSEKLQSTKTSVGVTKSRPVFYHSEKLQSTKTHSLNLLMG